MRRFTAGILSIVLSVVLTAGTVYAQSSSSSNYRVDQTFFGSGGELDAASASYRAKQTAGELAVGNTASANYQAWAGFNTTDDPYIEFVVTASNIDLGYLDTATTKTANGTFYVRAWESSGYTVRTEADPPTNTENNHQITPLASPTAPGAGTEQFGINLVANTVPTAFGAVPLQSPNGSFSFGQALPGYNTPDVFKYVKGDPIAQSTQNTSVTVYTVSYIFNIDNTTASGKYTFNHVLVATATY